MSIDRVQELRTHLKGSPSVEAVAAVAGAMARLVAPGVPFEITANAVCDTCGARSEPVDLAHPADAEAGLRADGWVRDAGAMTDTCPSCARGEQS